MHMLQVIPRVWVSRRMQGRAVGGDLGCPSNTSQIDEIEQRRVNVTVAA